MKKLLAIRLVLLSTSVWAEWVLIAKTRIGELFYVDPTTKKSGSRPRVCQFVQYASMLVSTIVAALLLLTSCATDPGNAPLTEAERQFFDRIDPDASVVTIISDQTIEVSNTTYPATDWGFLGERRSLEVFKTIRPYYQKTSRVYHEPAVRHCASLGRYPNEGTATSTYAKRFTCQLPKQWLFENIRYKADGCRQNGAKFALHPCMGDPTLLNQSTIYRDMCSAYSNLTNSIMSPTSVQTCADFLVQFNRIEAGLNNRIEAVLNEGPTTSYGTAKTIEAAKQDCTELGFSPKTEKHADCVLRLTK
jgi:hypothetical protein